MRIDFDNCEESRKYFKSAYRDPEVFRHHRAYRKLTGEFHFSIDNVSYTIKPGFWWDGASIPRFLWPVIGNPWAEDIAPGALIHDALYGSHAFPRHKCDDIMDAVNNKNGMSWWRRRAVREGLRVGGAGAYTSKTIQNINGVRRHLVLGGGVLLGEVSE